MAGKRGRRKDIEGNVSGFSSCAGRCIVSTAAGSPKTDVLEPRPLEDWAFGKRSPLGWLLLLVIILLFFAIMAIMNIAKWWD